MDNFISHSEFYYTRMMLFSWTCDSTPTSLSQSNGDFFVECLQNILDKDIDVIVINCNEINDIEDHFIDPLVEYLKNTKKTIIFFSNDKKAKLVNHLDQHVSQNDQIENNKIFSEGDTRTYCIDNCDLSSSKVDSFIKEALSLEKKWLKKQIRKTYTEYPAPKRLSSTPLIASGEFNATAILSNPSKYKWIAILLAELINNLIQVERPKSYTIIAASLRGAAIAGAVWELLYFVSKPTLHIIDHLGPRYNILEIPRQENHFITTYCIYIGDFMIGGTEAKIVQSYCNLMGGKIKHAFVVGNYIKDEYINSDIKLHALVSLGDCVDSLKYSLGDL